MDNGKTLVLLLCVVYLISGKPFLVSQILREQLQGFREFFQVSRLHFVLHKKNKRSLRRGEETIINTFTISFIWEYFSRGNASEGSAHHQ